jgi:hypothetical protein
MLRVVCILAGLCLALYGGGLAYEELGLIEARHVARDRGPKGLKASDETLDAAFRLASAVGAPGEERAQLMLDLALALESRRGAGDAARAALDRERIYSAALRLTHLAPLSARAWCALALANAKAEGVTVRAASQLEACYHYGPREITVVDGRLAFSLAAWDALPLSVRNAAMIDVAVGLRDEHLRWRMVDRLANIVVTVAPARAALAATLVEQYGEQLKGQYSKALERYRRSGQTGGFRK